MSQGISWTSVAFKFRTVSVSVNNPPVRPTPQPPRRSCAEWGKKEAERDSARVRETRKRRSRLHPPRSVHQRRRHHRGTGICWPGPGTDLRWSTDPRHTHRCPFHTLNRNRNSSSLGLYWIIGCEMGKEKSLPSRLGIVRSHLPTPIQLTYT